MALIRHVRKSGGSLSLPIPADFVKVLDLKPGDPMEFVPLGKDAFTIRRASSAPPTSEG